MASRSRRTTLKLTLLGLAALVHGCSGGGGAASGEMQDPGGPPPPPPPGPPQPWVPGPLTFIAGRGDTIDLTGTLPAHIERRGTFSLAPNSAPLPAGMTLEANGMLHVGSAAGGSVADVVFEYTEP
jgi:hypothetical protein